MNKNNYIVHK